MALTWRNVDVPVGLTKAADQVQQSFRDVANNLKAGIDQYAGMQQNNQMAALEARLSQEQQLGNVDPLAALDAGQLRSEFGGFIDPSQARNQILNRQKGLEQKLVGDFNEAYQQGNSDQMTNLSQQLMGREGDFSEVENKLRTFNLGNSIQEGNFEEGLKLARNDQERGVINNAAYNSFMKNNDFSNARQYATTPEQAMVIDQRIIQEGTKAIGKEVGTEFQKYLADPSLNESDFIKLANEKIYALPFEQQGPAKQALSHMIESMTQRLTNKVTIAPQAKPYIDQSLADVGNAVERTLAPERLAIERQAALAGNLASMETMKTVLNNNFNTIKPTEFNTLVQELNKTGEWIIGDFNLDDVQRRAKEAGINLNNYSTNAVLMALAGTEFNKFFDSDKDENQTFKDNLDFIQANIEASVNGTYDIKEAQLRLDSKGADLTTQIKAEILNRGNKLTVSALGAAPLSGDLAMQLDPNGLAQSLYTQAQTARIAGRNSTVGTNNPENVLGALKAGTDGNTGNTDNNNPQPPAPTSEEPISSQANFANATKQFAKNRLVKEEAKLQQLINDQKNLGSSGFFGISDKRIESQRKEIERLNKLVNQ